MDTLRFILFTQALASITCIVLYVAWIAVAFGHDGHSVLDLAPLQSLFVLLLACPIVGASSLRKRLALNNVTKRALTVYFLFSILGLLGAGAFFSSPMHDIALIFFNSHGRFGCCDLGAGYFFTGDTLPLLLFAPQPIFVAISVARAKRQQLRASG